MASYATGDVGGLVGLNGGTITASYATGAVDGGDGHDLVGGLVGQNVNGGTITASYAGGDVDGDVDGGDGSSDRVGGLVGLNNGGTITASYATGAVDGGDGGDAIGGLVGLNNGGTITASYATGMVDGGDGDFDAVGGLVGFNDGGTITTSHASGDVDGGDGRDNVGGLVGQNVNGGTITASYAGGDVDGDVDGGDGSSDRVGGLVGLNNGGTITASYATGAVDGGDGGDAIGGLVGVSVGTIITASYATGMVDGGDGDLDNVGGLVGVNGGSTIRASYGFGTQMGGEIAGIDRSDDASPAVIGASQLTADNSSTATPAGTNDWPMRVWNFGTARQIPRLKWITGFVSSGATDVLRYPCERTLLPTGQSCGGVIPGQDSSLLADGDGDDVPDDIDVDDDNDGLIEIRFLEDLDYVRHSLAGTSYKPGASATAHTVGGPAGGLKGYELARSLDFDEDGSYRNGSVNTAWTDSAGPNTGWTPIGDNSTDDDTTRFAAIFEGNGHTIGDLRIARQKIDRTNSGGSKISYVGLFGYVGGSGEVRNLVLRDARITYTGSDFSSVGALAGASEGTMKTVSSSGLSSSVDGGDGQDNVGGLVGWNGSGTITASYASGMVDGGDGNFDRVGGLVGWTQFGSTITASYATGAVDGGDGDDDRVGGLVGRNESTITASYATGDVDGGDGVSDRVGGLVGRNNRGTVAASYASGTVDGGDGNSDYVGGLVGLNSDDSTLTASYATGRVNGGNGNDDNVGGLVGRNSGMTTTSYATGDVDGGDGGSDRVGELVGRHARGTVTTSYGFGTQTGGEVTTETVDRSGDASRAGTVIGASQLTAANSSTEMDNRWSARVWNFGTARQIPRLKWITGFDSSGATDVLRYPCDRTLLPSGQSCGGVIPGQDSTLLADGDGDNVPDDIDVDDDNDGLIEIRFLEDLDYVRHSLAGTSYKPGASATAHTIGGPAGGLKGYELARSLDFDEDGSYRSGSVNTAWTNSAGPNTGWTPIGDNSTDDDTTRFTAMFEGNGHTIGDLRIARDIANVGLFGYVGGSGEVRDLALSNAQVDYTGNSDGFNFIGTVAGRSSGTMRTVRSVGLSSSVDGGDGNRDYVGGLVGENSGTITASYATGDVDGGNGNEDRVGGLAGRNEGDSRITASYASGDIDGGDGDDDSVGGLAGINYGTITASYATGDVDGGTGNDDRVGGLAGRNEVDSRITASYAGGNIDGGDGHDDSVGGLAGINYGTITASYASGMVDGGDGGSDRVGDLVGWNRSGTIMASYGFGTQMGGETAGVDRSGDASPAGTVANAAALTAANSSVGADGIDGNTDDSDWPTRVWDFTTGMNPGLRWITGFVSGGATEVLKYPCDMALLPTLPTQQTCGGVIPGQVRTP